MAVVAVGLEFFAEAAICQAGIDLPLLLPSKVNGVVVPVWVRDVVIPGAGAGVPIVDVLLVAGISSGLVAAADWGLEVDVGAEAAGVVAVELPPIRFPINTFNPLSSLPNSFTRSSPWDFHPSNALGINSRNPLTSSPNRLDSSSRRLFADFNSSITEPTSSSATSSFCWRCVSASFNTVVSVVSCSMRSKAFAKEASMEALSDESCAGVGGTIRGAM